MLPSGRVSFYPSCEYVGEGRFVSRLSGEEHRGPRRGAGRRRPLPLAADPGDDPAAVRRWPTARTSYPSTSWSTLGGAPSQFVIVGSGKTATDACVWLLGNGVDPDAICWVRPRDPWMLNRAVVQPNPAVFIGMARGHDGGGGRRGDARRPVPATWRSAA